MFTGSSFRRLALAVALALVSSLSAAAAGNTGRWLTVKFPDDSPVLQVSSSMGATTASPRGVSMAIDLHASLVLRNVGRKTISSLTLRVEAQDLTPSGKGSVIMPSLYVQPGETFPVRIDMELLRPFTVSKNDSALVEVSLDCALFNDLSSYGPDRLHSLRALLVYELEAKRDRRYLAALLDSGRLPELRRELNFGLEDALPEQLGLELLQGPHTSSRHEQAVTVNTVSFPSSPVQPIRGAAQVAGNEVRTPEVEVRNTSHRMVRSIEMGWIVRDERGRDFVAGSVPSALRLGPVQTASMSEPGTLRFSRSTGQPMVIGGLMAFVNDVEFADGNLWIPSRSDIDEATSDPILRRELATSPEQQRLADIFRRKGMSGLAEELRRPN
ncbi:MAG TPA: hypothetical protein VGL97_11180 [Bryobacteraceae bacterium]